MRDRASFTAGWVAACRTLGKKLPREAQIADDPYGASFVGPIAELFARHAPRVVTVAFDSFVLYMQVRTRVIDDAVRAFTASGGRQILILGAGYDARAARLSDSLDNARVFEVDHPSTQTRKREVLARATNHWENKVEYVAWNFESRALAELPSALAEHGHDRRAPTLTIWEGVTMYLSERAIEESIAAIAALSCADSVLVMTYFDKARFDRPSRGTRIVSRIVATSGEPFRFGFDPAALSAWTSARGFRVVWDKSMSALAHEVLPVRFATRVTGSHSSQSHIAYLAYLAER